MTTPLALTLGAFLLTTTIALHVAGLYGLLLPLAALFTTRRSSSPGCGLRDGVLPRIAVLVVAHDEETVIDGSVRSLLAQQYPGGTFEVLVVADRCTDRTATIARAAGVRVLERTTGGTGKALAVAFGVDALAREDRFDAVAIFDADNHADPDFLAAIGARLAGGERVVQGLVDAKNPGASWVSASSALGFWAIAGLAQAPRERLGLSAPLMGTGFALRLEDAVTLLGTAVSLTDDLELGARLAEAGIRVAYEGSARTVDEKPTALGTALAQRHRWMQGRWAVAGRAGPRLLGAALGRGPAGSIARLRCLDVALQLVLPSLLFTGVALALTATATATLAAFAPEAGSVAAWIPVPWSLGLAAVCFAAPALGIARFHPPLAVWACYAVQPAYLLLSAPLAVSGWLLRGRREWRRTPKGA